VFIAGKREIPVQNTSGWFSGSEIASAIPQQGSWRMALSSMTVSAFVDESGKFKDHDVIALGCVGDYAERLVDFHHEWGRLLRVNGLKDLSAKKVFNYNRPLSKNNSDTGLKKRIKSLRPFIICIRKHLQVAIGCAVDVREFKKLPPHFFQIWGHDPAYLAFVKIMLQIANFTSDSDKISLICDEDEETALPFYGLYRRVKKVWPDARNKLAAISFGDDSVLYGVQAADLIASLVRLDAAARLTKARYDYKPLFKLLTADPDNKHERIWYFGVATADKKSLRATAKDAAAELKKRIAGKS
jgi:hypothetical protein